MATIDDLFDLTGKVAIITGGAGDIGVAYARALCEVGAASVIADLNAGAATSVADTLIAEGYQALGVSVDVTSLDSVTAMVAAAVDAFGGVDILINNAAIMTDLPPYGLSNMPASEWDRVMSVNLRGPLFCTQAVVESIVSRGGGRIINGLSAGAFMSSGIYGVSKLALRRPHGESRQ